MRSERRRVRWGISDAHGSGARARAAEPDAAPGALPEPAPAEAPTVEEGAAAVPVAPWRRARHPRPQAAPRWERVAVRYLGRVGQHNRYTLTITGIVAVAEITLLSSYLLTHGSWPTPDVLVLALAPVALIIARPHWFLIDWGIFLGLWLVWQALADASGPPTLDGVHFTWMIDTDRWLFDGILPSIALQQAFFRLDRLSWYDYAATFVHTAHFATPIALAFLLWLKSRALFWRMAAVILVTSYIGLIIYWRYPAAPPWLASDEGMFAPESVWRILVSTTSHFPADVPISWVYQQFGGNAVAAMPSLHAAMPVIVALTIWRVFPRWTPLGVLYVIAMWLSIVYLGEHYVTDALVGGGIAAATFAVIWPLGAALSRWWARAFPRHAPRACPAARAHGLAPERGLPGWWEAARAVLLPGLPLVALLWFLWGPLGIRPAGATGPWLITGPPAPPPCTEQPGEALGGAEGQLAPLDAPAALFVEDLTTKECYIADAGGVVPLSEQRDIWLTALSRAVSWEPPADLSPVLDGMTVVPRTGLAEEILDDPSLTSEHVFGVAVVVQGEVDPNTVEPVLTDAARAALTALLQTP